MKYNLSNRAKLIYEELEDHCRNRLQLETIFYLELSMLADSFANYFDAAEYCAEHGNVYEMPTKTGTYPMVHPSYTVKNKEYVNILKHAPKYGLNPSDFNKLEGLMPEKEEPVGTARFKIAK